MLNNEYKQLLKIMNSYPEIFTTSNDMSRDTFMKFFGQVCTRCFGWGMPYTSMIPMADNYNHSDCNTVYEVIHKQMHMEADEESPYFCKGKYMNDYSFIFQDELDGLEGDDSKAATEHRRNIKGRYINSNYAANK